MNSLQNKETNGKQMEYKQIGKEEVKLSLLADVMILYLKDS
jgi:hypothetical protein